MVTVNQRILFEEVETYSNHVIGVATLNAEASLNALTLEMIDSLSARLEAWQADELVVCVVLQGAGEKAFCAGGDIVQLYQSMKAHPTGPNPYAEAFFSREYQLDYLIHTYAKPLICLGHGIVMGGGLGLMAGASHRIVTESSRIAMPEITLGLFPDVGGSWFLNQMPERIGLFLGLTGASINATDALYLGLADHFLESGKRSALLPLLKEADWTGVPDVNHMLVTMALMQLSAGETDKKPAAQVEAHQALIRNVTRGRSLVKVCEQILALDTGDSWLRRAQQNLQRGCPVSAHLVWHQTREGRYWSLEEVFEHELRMALQCTRHPDFAEGVRALLIDKDNQPRWQYASVAEVPESWIEPYL
ncbi:MAG: enoyl-CoA hydratase/isomerase family protein [Hahellaceae bacterium]|nr:enoyl-CoA hydratase/isomerase family protein [Hahellaceae bacterium]MCP5169239.1 enoyl-CoA hydratase/isomerase family protein [Hahellaceae bacterium]